MAVGASASTGGASGGLPLLRVLGPDGGFNEVLDPGLESMELASIFRSMLMLRVLDERMLLMQRQGRIGFYGACTGQEAAVIGSGAALGAEDWVFPGLREGGVMLHRGYPLQKYLGQIFGSSADPARGRQMPSHMSDRAVHQVSWSSCIGSQLPQAAGAAWASRIRGESKVVVAYLGDGATSSADFHYALNFAGVFRLPVVFFCQNNGWSISVPTSEQTASRTIAHKAVAYGLPGYRVDGNDPLAVYAVTSGALRRARQGEGPSLVEAVTYRMGAHSSSDDPTRYRDEAEVALWRGRDPIERFGAHLARRGVMSAEAQASLREELEQMVREEVAQAEKVGPPPSETLFDDVYAVAPWQLAAQRAEHLAGTSDSNGGD